MTPEAWFLFTAVCGFSTIAIACVLGMFGGLDRIREDSFPYFVMSFVFIGAWASIAIGILGFIVRIIYKAVA